MEIACKIIRLKPERTYVADLTKENVHGEHITHSELQAMVVKARNVLDTMEEEWQVNHNSVILMEQFHLLRNYLEVLRRYHEGNI